MLNRKDLSRFVRHYRLLFVKFIVYQKTAHSSSYTKRYFREENFLERVIVINHTYLRVMTHDLKGKKQAREWRYPYEEP